MIRWGGLFLGFVAASSALTLNYSGHLAAGVVMGCVALLVLLVAAAGPAVRRQWLDAKAEIRKAWEQEQAPEPPPRPRMETVPRVKTEGHPPWDTARMPARPGPVDADEPEVAGKHRAERGLREVLMDALKAAARVPLP